MSKFFDDTMQGLLEAVAIDCQKREHKNNSQYIIESVLLEEWTRLGYIDDEAKELVEASKVYI